MSLPLWDDDAFKQRVKAAARRKGMPVRQVLEAAGLSPYYLRKTVGGRSTNHVLNLARVLEAPPAEMLGVAGPETSPLPARSETPPRIDGERLRLAMIAAQIILAPLFAEVAR